MTGQITLIRLTERPEARDDWKGDVLAEEIEIEIEVIERR